MIGKEIYGLDDGGGAGMTYRLYDDDLGLDLWRHAGPIVGTHPELHGTDGDDTFTGTDGDDRYSGGHGKDVISGGAGRDHLFGGDGDDVITGGSGNDVMKGGPGHDVMHGGNGNDVVKADPNGGDILYGDNGNDVLAEDYSKLFGGSGDDSLEGSECSMKGGAGNDSLYIGNAFLIDDHSHLVSGGAGNNSFAFSSDGNYLGGGSEMIKDLNNNDYIDLSILDGNSLKGGIQPFHLVSKFDGQPGEVTVNYDAEHNQTVIDLYTNKDSIPDGIILTPGDHHDFSQFVF